MHLDTVVGVAIARPSGPKKVKSSIESKGANFASCIFPSGSHFARETYPACPAYRGVKCGSVRIAIFDYQTALPLPRARGQTVKPFEQREFKGTVTICPELKIPNQTVTLKQARTDRAGDCARGAGVCYCARDLPRLSSLPGGQSWVPVACTRFDLQHAYDHGYVRSGE